MRDVCLTLPTNRECADTITAVGAEAAYAVRRFDVRVHLLVLDSADPATRARHARAVAALPAVDGVHVHHLDEDAQRAFLREVIDRSGVAGPDKLLDLMLPDAVSYGACTNRAFLIAAALGCASVHRRDSDSRYQWLHGEPVFPIEHELATLGRRAADAAAGVTEYTLDPAHADKPVALVGASFVGELSVDIGEILELDPEVYHDVVALWAPTGASEQEKRELVAQSFVGGGTEPFTTDRTVLDRPGIWHIDMCNIGLHHEVYERVPLPPATETIGSDYFLHHLVYDATLPGVTHNRHIVNYYTPERRTGPGFTAYQLRYAKFLLSMLYLHPVYAEMTEAGGALLDEQHRVRPEAIADSARRSATTDRAENHRRLAELDRCYRQLGGKYAEFADHLASRRVRLLDEAQADIEDFALLIDAWGPLVRASRTTPADRLPGRVRAGSTT
ncbi:DUF6271 family protein [Streptomyces sp. 1331.2]|uniref:DUF6271 family protein n=1 Tax=Streptomyces sp. 1331.2 TaxID=1938835 RepID=UPI000BDB8C78|nr:DUF6271 family protein [Streptomyces sp. 1331.2]SOB79789.1 hypothetical protein SAMN06272789_0612 [Streptomyces sp. 1331.2]